MKPIVSDNLIQNLTDFVDSLNPKQRNIIEKRYGLTGEKPMTLEAIGQENGVTRERIRQIEETALKSLRGDLNSLQNVVDELKYHLDILGGIRREKRLLEELSHSMAEDQTKLGKNEKVASQLQNNIWFLLDLSPNFNYLLEKKDNHAGWYREENNLKKFDSISKFVRKELNKNGKPLELDQYQQLIRRVMKEFNIKNENVLLSYLDVSKEFDFNPFGEFGLTEWGLIHPAGVNTKAYMILKKQNQPLHFEDIANLINKVGFDDDRQAHANTVHNELIKDPQFVLVGRGLYALKEWGFEPGTVKDVLVKVLKKEGPKTYRELVEAIKKHRIVKDTTILINLQDKKLFKKNAEGRYTLVR